MDQGKEAGGGGRHSGRLSRRFVISGRVQGVGFRYFVLRRAETLGVTGWVRNLPAGEVEVLASGSPEQLASLEEHLWKGPRFSNVTNVENREISDEPEQPTGFQIID